MHALPSLIVIVALMVPLMVAIAISDLKTLRIPNRMVLAVFVIFLVTSLPGGPAGLDWGLPWETFLWRLAYAVLAFGAGFLLYIVAGGRVGGGDLKLIAAIAPFLYAGNLEGFLVSYAAVCLIGLLLHFMARKLVLSGDTGWRALDQTLYFPAGLALGIATTVVLTYELFQRLDWL